MQRALGELERIAARRLPEQGRYEEYYELIARVLRRYVRERYGLPALERTPRELRAELERAGVDRAQVVMIGEILGEGDAVRFRNVVPYPAHAQRAVRHALEVMRKAAAAEQYEMAPLQVR